MNGIHDSENKCGRVLATVAAESGRHVERLQRYIRQRSISAYADGNDAMAEIIAHDIRDLGGEAQSVPGVDFPIVYGRIDAGAERTVLIHGMYDTTPADESDWISPPFEAARVRYGALGECIIGRGAEDTKGPLAAALAMVAAHRSAGVELPVNLIFVYEASELGSRSLAPFIEAHAEELRAADVAYWPWHTQRADGTAVAWLGVKGLMTMRMRVRGGEWGGPVGDPAHGLHSIWVANPVHRLVAALACFKSPDDLEVAIEGFYDPVPPVTAHDEALIQGLCARVDPQAILEAVGARRFKQSDPEQALRSYCFKTEINISGIAGGAVIEGGHNVQLPCEAVAALDTRPLDGMTPEHIRSCMRRHLDSRGFPEIEIEVLNGYQGGSMSSENWAVTALLATYRDCGHDPEVWPRTTTAICSHLFIEHLGIPWIATTLGHAGHKHASNEYLQVKGYEDAIAFMVRLVWKLAGATVPAG